MKRNIQMRSPLRAAPCFARRRIFALTGLALLCVCKGNSVFGETLQENDNPIRQPVHSGEEAFIDRAFEMRRSAIEFGDQAYGAVIVRDRVIVGQSWSRVILDNDPTAHAEMEATRDAARRLNSRDLSGSVMYSTSRPCPMCEAAAYWAGVVQLVYGRDMRTGGSPNLCS